MQEPVIQDLKKKHGSAVYKIDASREREAASAYGVLGVPFIVLIEDGVVVNAKAGIQSETALAGFLN